MKKPLEEKPPGSVVGPDQGGTEEGTKHLYNPFEEALRNGASLHLDDSLPDDDKFRATYPVLWFGLTNRDLDTEHTKIRAKLSVFIERGAWVISLQDDFPGRTLRLEAPTFDMIATVLETALRNPETIWTYWKDHKPKKVKKPKKEEKA